LDELTEKAEVRVALGEAAARRPTDEADREEDAVVHCPPDEAEREEDAARTDREEALGEDLKALGDDLNVSELSAFVVTAVDAAMLLDKRVRGDA